MWNKLKGFLGFLIVAGCVLIFVSFIPIDFLSAYSGQLEHYGLLLMGFGSLAFLIVLILLGINEHIYRFKPDYRRAIGRSKRVTREVAAISLLALIITGLGWLVVRSQLIASRTLTPDEVMSNPEKYVGKKVSVAGYYYSSWSLFNYDVDHYGAVFTEEIPFTGSEGERLKFAWRLLSGEQLPLVVELPSGKDADSFERYVFTGVVKMEHVGMCPLFTSKENWPILEVSSLVEL